MTVGCYSHHSSYIEERTQAMKRKGKVFLALIGIILILPICTWAFFGSYGKLRVQPRGPERVTIEILEERWEDYDVYFAGPWIGRPSAVMFDPKDDDRKLVPHKWWVSVKKKVSGTSKKSKLGIRRPLSFMLNSTTLFLFPTDKPFMMRVPHRTRPFSRSPVQTTMTSL